MSVRPGTPPPMFVSTSRRARPMVAFALVPWPNTLVPLFRPIACRIGPWTNTTGATGWVVAWIAARLNAGLAMPLSAASSTGMYAGRHPAITALMATFSTVATAPLGATGAIPFFPIWAGAALGAILGSTFSWWLGWRYGEKILTMWPLKDHPDLVDRAAGTFKKWGVGAVFLGHFIGPLRPVIFLFAGMMKMGFLPFITVNTLSALAWAWLIPKLGEVSGLAFGWGWNALGF
ncbi:MAG: hypothetical protein CFE34_09050 [Rhodobacteraceae bacterium PARR1]|nr:MAG: hypothetical protein CFE34_09050 [Rhodobacteraceae bacterium PARR1]